MKVAGLSDEDWDMRNTAGGQALVAQNSKVLDLLIRGNVAGAHRLVTGVVGPGLQGLFTRKPKQD